MPLLLVTNENSRFPSSYQHVPSSTQGNGPLISTVSHTLSSCSSSALQASISWGSCSCGSWSSRRQRASSGRRPERCRRPATAAQGRQTSADHRRQQAPGTEERHSSTHRDDRRAPTTGDSRRLAQRRDTAQLTGTTDERRPQETAGAWHRGGTQLNSQGRQTSADHRRQQAPGTEEGHSSTHRDDRRAPTTGDSRRLAQRRDTAPGSS